MDNSGLYNIQIALENIRYDMMELGANVVWLGQSIFVLAAMLYFAKVAYEAFLGGNIFTLAVLKPFAIAIVLSMYPIFMGALDGIIMSVNNGLALSFTTLDEVSIVDVVQTRDLNPYTENDDNLIGLEQIHATEDPAAAAIVNYQSEQINETQDAGFFSWQGFNALQWIGDKFYWAMMRLIEQILHIVSHAMMVLINTLRVFFLIILYTIGPLVIGISLFPGFGGILTQWLGRYLSVHLWLGVGHIYDAIAVKLWRIFLDNGGLWTTGTGLDADTTSYAMTSWSWIFLICLIIGYATIPIVSSWIISAAGLGQAGGLLAAQLNRSIGKGMVNTAAARFVK